MESDIFESCSVIVVHFRMLLLEALYDALTSQRDTRFWNITMEVISEVAEVMVDAASMWIRID